MSSDPATAWLKANDPEASTPGFGDRYSAVPRRQRREIPASAVNWVDDDGNATPFDLGSLDGLYEDDDEPGGAYVPAELQDAELEDAPSEWPQAGPASMRLGPEFPKPDPGHRPVSHYRKALAERLTASELAHLAWIERGDNQGDIAARLGIGQSAISKRERILLAKVAEIHLLITGRPYPLATRRRPGARGRQKSPVGQE